MRDQFEEQLRELNEQLREMGTRCKDVISRAAEAFRNGDVEQALGIRAESAVIDRLERDIENCCMKLLLHQQPVAADFRLVSAALKMITDMERIGDQAEDIAEIVVFLDGSTMAEASMIDEMARETIAMVTGSVDAFVKKDTVLARRVITRDDLVDRCFSEVRKQIIRLIAEDAADGEQALDLLMIAKYFERIGDHAVNIAEWVIYSVTGAHEPEISC